MAHHYCSQPCVLGCPGKDKQEILLQPLNQSQLAAPTLHTLLSPNLPGQSCRTALNPCSCLWKLQLLCSLTPELSPGLPLLSYVTTALHMRNNYHTAMDVVCILAAVQSLAAGGLRQCRQPITGLGHTCHHHSKVARLGHWPPHCHCREGAQQWPELPQDWTLGSEWG